MQVSRNAPHPSAAVEGYYFKFDLQDGSHLILVLCSVRHAPSKRHMLSFTHYPAHGTDVWQRQYYDKEILMHSRGPHGDFDLLIPSVGGATFKAPGQWTYDFQLEDFHFSASTRGHTPWSRRQTLTGTESSPEHWLSLLPLPLHWHVSSLASPVAFSLAPSSATSTLPPSIPAVGTAQLHQEKNWGDSFPKKHVWMQARGPRGSGICLAGGSILGLQAFLLGHRRGALDPAALSSSTNSSSSSSAGAAEDENEDGDEEWDFRPPFSMQILGYSPFLWQDVDWAGRSVRLDLSDFRRRITVRASAPGDSFFSIGAPFAGGHVDGRLAQSFRATIEVVRFRRAWLGGRWREVARQTFEGASLEFGGEYYGGRATGDGREAL